ncbi:MAG: hypothetical protein KGN02_08330 [bacterium]|nr:hypothetical protein [bacterium]
MNENVEQIPLSRELLALMRHAVDVASSLREPFVSVRALLLALLDEPALGAALEPVLPRERLDAYALPEDAGTRLTASRVPEPKLRPGERAAMLRFNTLAFKTPDGTRSVWLSREAHAVWIEGAKRVGENGAYLPKHLALGIAADAVRSPGIFAQLHLAPGAIVDAITAHEQEEKKAKR